MKYKAPVRNVTCIIGGLYGSEGKGRVCGWLANEFDIAVRVGAPNAGHTLKVGNKIWKMQQIPVAGLLNQNMTLCIGAGGLINLDILKRELGYIQYPERLWIDRNAGILEKAHQREEEHRKMFEGIGSTCEGVGAALEHKIRRHGFKTATDIPVLKNHITNVSLYLNSQFNKQIMIEGTQGYGLCLNHGTYPFCTSRDVLASSLLSDVGLSPFVCKDVIMVIRSYPIRVAGNSGPMCGKELTWEEVTHRSKSPVPLLEKTTVTKRVRRICEFNIEFVKEAIALNRPTQIALMFADYITYKDHGVCNFNKLSSLTRRFIDKIEEETNTPITLIGTSIEHEGMIDRRAHVKLKKPEFNFGRNKEIFDEGAHI